MSTIFYGPETIGRAAEYWVRINLYNTPLSDALLDWEGKPWFEAFISGLAEFSTANARAYTARYNEEANPVTVDEIKAFLQSRPNWYMASSPNGVAVRQSARSLVDLGQYNCDGEALGTLALSALLELARYLLRE